MSSPTSIRRILAGTLTAAMAVAGTAWAAGGSHAIKVPGSRVVLELWEGLDSNGQAAPHYAISYDGKTFGEPRATSYDIKLRYGEFDPLEVSALPEVPPSLASAEDTNIYIVQYFTHPIQAIREAMLDVGAEPLFFLANHCNIVRMDPNVIGEVEALPFVRWVGDFHPAYRLDPLVFDSIMNGQTGWQDYSIMVFGRGLDAQNAVADQLQALGGMVMNTADDGFRMTVTATPDMIAQIVRMDEVHFIDPWGPGELDMNIVREIGGANYVETETGFSGEGVRGEIFDTEVDADHPEWVTAQPLQHCPGGTSTHGSSCYGINFAQGIVPTARGLCPDGQGIFCYYNVSTQFGGPTTRLQLNTEATNPALQWRSCYQTSSVGSPRTTEYTTISAETDDYLFQVDYLSFQSQSNATDQMSRPQAWAKNICSVGGITHHDTLTRADDDYSAGSTGPAADGRIKPDLAHFYDNIDTTTSGGGYTSFGGTSGATPCTSGHGGLVMQMWHEQVWPDFGGGPSVFDDRPKSTTAKALLINTAYRYVWYGTSPPNPEVTRNRQGWGMADIGRLYNQRESTFIVNETEVLLEGGSATYNLAAIDPENGFRATMIYSDPAGTPGSSVHRVNDLTLKVTAPDGTVYWGNNGLHTSNWSSPDGVANHIDTTECVFIENPIQGVHSVDIIVEELNQDARLETPGVVDVDFALVVTGVSPGPGFGLSAAPSTQTICAPANAVYTIDVEQFEGFTDPVTLTHSGAPVGPTVTFADNPVIPPATTTMTVSNTGAGTPGMYNITITGTAGEMVRSAGVGLGLSTAVPSAVVLSSPANGATDVARQPTLAWQVEPQALDYDLQIATDAGFGNVVYAANTTDTSHEVATQLETITTYYWHVKANNGCGVGPWSDTWTFTTLDQPDYFTEFFDGGGFDLDNWTVEIIPDGSGDFYRICGYESTSLPTDPTGGNNLVLSDDDYEAVSPGTPVWLYGNSYTTFFVGSNGYITFDSGDTDWSETLEDHFSQIRISGLFDDLNPANGGTVSWKATADRVAVTWQGVPEYSNTGSNTFQIEMFFNGEIHITWTAVSSSDSIVGLSNGGGVPFDYEESDFSAVGPCTLPCPADINGDGVVDVLDLLAVLAAWGPCPGCPEDINGDGVVNVLDLLELLAAWGPCP